MGFFDTLKKAVGLDAAAASAECFIGSPVAGEAVALADIADPVFSGGMMGKGCGVRPNTGVAYAPVSGEVTAAFPTGHAFGLKTDDGVEVLIHIGTDTVSLNGEGFEIVAQQGQRIEKGAELAKFSSETIKAAGLDDTIIVVITNTDEFKDVELVSAGPVEAGANLLKVTK